MPINRATDKEDAMCVYICMRVYIYIYICVCVCVYTHTHTHTILARRKEWNNAIFSHMDKHRENHTKSSNSEKDNYHGITYMWNLKKNDMYDLSTKQK